MSGIVDPAGCEEHLPAAFSFIVSQDDRISCGGFNVNEKTCGDLKFPPGDDLLL
jgi:hypothetical protein